jgi:hypothetical protein
MAVLAGDAFLWRFFGSCGFFCKYLYEGFALWRVAVIVFP